MGATFANFRGLEMSGKISSLGAIAGVIVPGVMVAAVAVLWVVLGKQVEITVAAKELIPEIGNRTQLAFFIGVLLMFMGIEVSSAHAGEVRDPQTDFPRAIFMAAIVIVAVFIVGALAVAIIVPSGKIDLLTGVVQAFDRSLDTFGVGWGAPILGMLMVLGMIAQINSWLIGPAKFMLASARAGNLPPFFHRTNSKGVPVNILVVQALIVTAYSFVYLVMPSVTTSYWLLTVLASQLYLIVYMTMFLVALKLRYSSPDTPRAYEVPGGRPGIWFVTGLGIASSLFAFFAGFIPPVEGSGKEAHPLVYVGFLLTGIVVLCGSALIIERYRKPSWVAAELKNG